MEQDRADLVTAIIKLKDSINELNQKGRERLIDAFERLIENSMRFIRNCLMEEVLNLS